MRVSRHAVRWVLALALVASGHVVASQSPSTVRLLVLLRDASALAIVDPVAGTVLGRIPTVRDPHEVTASADGALAFVASPSDGISVIDLDARTELRRLDIGPGSEPHDVRFAGGKLYFTAEGYKVIGRYDPQRDEVEWLLGIGQDGTHMFVLSADHDTIFTANRGSNSVTVVEGVAAGPPDWRVTAIPVGGEFPEGIDLSPDGREVWAATRNDGGVFHHRCLHEGRRAEAQPEHAERQPSAVHTGRRPGARLRRSRRQSRGGGRRGSNRDRATGSRAERRAGATDGSRAYAALRGADAVAVIDLDTLAITGQISTGPGSGPGCMFWLETN